MKIPTDTNRRTVLKTISAGIVGSMALTGSATAQEGKENNYGNGNGIGTFLNERAKFKEMPIWESGIADMTGQSEVEVDVGSITSIDIPDGEFPGEPPAEGPFKFTPRVVQVSPGTTVRWMWTGNSFAFDPEKPWPHDVRSLDGTFHSPHQGTGSFEFSFDTTGTHLYFCTPHGNPGSKHPNLFGMRGAVKVVGKPLDQ